MPIYAYRCQDCGFEKDQLQKLSDPPITQCPSCNGQGFARILTAPAFQLKGSGWYVTDFRDQGKGAKSKPAEGSDGAAAADKGAAGSGSGDAAAAGASASGSEAATASAASGAATAGSSTSGAAPSTSSGSGSGTPAPA
jgi:putative FmdB family regulatory protein